MATVNARMLGLLRARTELFVAPVAPNGLTRGIGYHTSKILRALRALAIIVYARGKGARLLYGSVDDGWGGLYTIVFVAVARIFGLKICLHHHSYRYIVEKTAIMTMLMSVAGKYAIHVVLCDEMKVALARLYPGAQRFAVAPNAVARPDAAQRPKMGQGPLTLGILANLTFEKGLVEFVDLLEQGLQQGHDLRAVLAGPAVGAEECSFIRDKLEELGERLTWLGPVSGETKEAFFAGIDLFVFPTKYRTESFGLVLLEALLRHVPIIAPARGCICLFEPLQATSIVPLSENFVKSAVEVIARFAADPALLAKMQASAHTEGLSLNNTHEASLVSLADALVAEATTTPRQHDHLEAQEAQ